MGKLGAGRDLDVNMQKASGDQLLPVLKAALDQTRSAACITSSELDLPGPEIVYVNPAYCTMTGRAESEVIGETPRLMQGPLTSRPVLDRLRADLEAGRPFEGETVNYRKDGSPFLINWRIDPVKGEGGEITHFIATQSDVTRLRRAEFLQAAEQAIDRSVSTVLSRPGDTAENLDLLAADIVAATSDVVGYGQVSLHGSIRLGVRSVQFSVGPPIPEPVKLIAGPDGDRPLVESGSIDDRWWTGSLLDSERTGIAGALILSDLDRAELDFVHQDGLQRVAECAVRALDSVAEYERQRLQAIELQRSLLPSTPADVPGLDVAALYRPGAFASHIGGDWYDVLLGEDGVTLFVGDMAGSGVRAAADMGRLRLFVRVMLQQGASLPDLFAALNRFCSDEDLVATALAVNLELDGDSKPTGSMTITCAGHPPPVRTNRSATEILPVTPGPLLGIGGSPRYRVEQFDLSPDDMIVLFTDGLVERSDETIDVSLAKLVSLVADARSSIDPTIESLCTELVDRRMVEGSMDDVAVLGFQLSQAACGDS